MKDISKLTRLVLLGMAIVLQPAYGEDIQKEKINMTSGTTLEQKGKQLRVAVDMAYKKLEDANSLKPRGNDITEVVIRYIPVGTSFDDAEAILRNAGFSVSSRPRPNEKGYRPNKYDVVGAIVPFVEKDMTRVNLYVLLGPASPNDFSKVNRVDASFIVPSY